MDPFLFYDGRTPMIKVKKCKAKTFVIPRVNIFFPLLWLLGRAQKPDGLSVLNRPQRHFIEL